MHTRTRPCLRCIGNPGRVDSIDGGALGQRRDHDTRPVVCPSCHGTGQIVVVSR